MSDRKEHHSIRVTVLLTADEYLNLQTMSEEDGSSDSGLFRRLFKQEVKKRVLKRLSDEQALRDSEEPAQVVRSKWVAA